jgi:peptide/nickel transport system permease protein
MRGVGNLSVDNHRDQEGKLSMWSKRKKFLFGLSIVVCFLLIAILAPWITLHDPYHQDLSSRLLLPFWTEHGSWEYPLGTDELGRDYFSRLVYGARVSIAVGFIVVAISAPIGLLLGIIGGYFGGRTDGVIMFIITTRLALPVVLVTLAIVSITGGSFVVAVLVLGFLFWDRFAIVTRSATQQLRNKQFVTAARAYGSSHAQILFTEIMPNVVNQILTIVSIEMAHAILVEAALSFLGLGVQPPTPSWGLMVAESRALSFFLPHLVTLPGLAIFFLVLGFNLLGDGLQSLNRR